MRISTIPTFPPLDDEFFAKARAGIDWSRCKEVESVADRCSGAWVVKDRRVIVSGILDNADADETPLQIARMFALPVATVRKVLAFAYTAQLRDLLGRPPCQAMDTQGRLSPRQTDPPACAHRQGITALIHCMRTQFEARAQSHDGRPEARINPRKKCSGGAGMFASPSPLANERVEVHLRAFRVEWRHRTFSALEQIDARTPPQAVGR
jgi:uncharacterized protein (DUF433 family)